MRIYVEPDRMQWPSLTRRVSRDDAMLDWRVTEILKSVKEGGDMALYQVIRFVEGFVPENLKVTQEEFDSAEDHVPEDLKEAIRVAAKTRTLFIGCSLYGSGSSGNRRCRGYSHRTPGCRPLR